MSSDDDAQGFASGNKNFIALKTLARPNEFRDEALAQLKQRPQWAIAAIYNETYSKPEWVVSDTL